jgi:hypothetical protein
METQNTTEEKKKFPYPLKIQGLLDPVFYTITNEELEDEDSFEGVENIYFIEKDGIKIPLLEAVTEMLSTSILAKEFIGLFERNEKMRNQQKAYFSRRLESDLKESKRLEGKNDSYLEVCRQTYKILKESNQE